MQDPVNGPHPRRLTTGGEGRYRWSQLESMMNESIPQRNPDLPTTLSGRQWLLLLRFFGPGTIDIAGTL